MKSNKSFITMYCERIMEAIDSFEFDSFTDRPLILSSFYNSKYGDDSIEFHNIVMHEVNKFKNVDIFLKRTKPYDPNGRNQTEEESDAFSEEILNMLYNIGMDPTVLDAEEYFIAKEIFSILAKKESENLQ